MARHRRGANLLVRSKTKQSDPARCAARLSASRGESRLGQNAGVTRNAGAAVQCLCTRCRTKKRYDVTTTGNTQSRRTAMPDELLSMRHRYYGNWGRDFRREGNCSTSGVRMDFSWMRHSAKGGRRRESNWMTERRCMEGRNWV